MDRPTTLRTASLIAVAISVALASAGCGGPPDPPVSDPTSLASPPASWQPASIAPGAGVEHACVLSESQAEAILRRDVAAPEVSDGAYDNVACSFGGELNIEMSPPVLNAARRVISGAESQARQMAELRQRELPTDQPSYFFTFREEDAHILFALGDHVTTLSWIRTGDETFDELTAMAIALVEAISASWTAQRQ